ncbi:hypothetical protein BH09VER1_BH09VER1_13260 [soil metagenome]
MNKVSFWVLSSIGLLLAGSCPAPGEDLNSPSVIELRNPGFEVPYNTVDIKGAKSQITGELADGWQDNSDWADLTAEYSVDAVNPHSGENSQKVTLSRLGSGAVQLKQDVRFQPGHQYTFSIWLRGKPGTHVSLQLRRSSEPYTTYATVPVTLAEEWTKFSITGVTTDDVPGNVMLLAGEPTTFWMDDAEFKDITQANGAVEVTLKNSSLEGPYLNLPPPGAGKKSQITGSIANGWGDNSGWADVEIAYAPDTERTHSGKMAQRISVGRVAGGAVQFVQDVEFKKGIYAYSVWLRGMPGTTVNLVLRRMDPATQYASTTATLSDGWQQFTVAGVVPEDAHGLLMLITKSPATFWVDDARLQDLTNAASSAEPHKGNLLTAGSFEAGLSFGWRVGTSGNMKNRFADLRPISDDTTATAGTHSIRIEIPAGDTTEMSSPAMPFNINRPHTFSVDLKASLPNTPVTVWLDGMENKVSWSVGTEWKRYTFTATPPYGEFTHVNLNCSPPEGSPARTLWVDGAQLEEGDKASPYQAAFPHELTLHINRPGSVVLDGEKEKVFVNVGPPAPEGARLKLSVVDLYGNKREIADVPLPAENFDLPDYEVNPRGMFKLHGEVVDKDGKAISAPSEMVWARLPKPREIDPEKSFFGIHIPLTKDFIALCRATGTRWTRLHDSSMIGKWAIEEPKQGQWEFHDDGVTAAHDGGMAILGLLDGAPAWASKKPRAATGYWSVWNIPDGTANWENYVRTVAAHYKGRIDYWEIWNEPWGEWWLGAGGKPEGYAELMKTAYKAAKEVNPNAHIVGVDTYRGNPWAANVLAASGLDSFDGFSYHDYSEALYGGPESQAHLDAKQYNDAQSKYGTPKQLWDTEGGPGIMGSFYLPEAGGLGPRQQLAQSVRFDVTSMAAGVKAFFLYAIHREGPMGVGNYNAIEHDRAIRPILAARAVLASLVDGAKCLGRTEPMKGVDSYQFEQTDGQQISVVWSYDGGTHEVPIPDGSHGLDVLGNPLPGGMIKVGVEPVYFIK